MFTLKLQFRCRDRYKGCACLFPPMKLMAIGDERFKSWKWQELLPSTFCFLWSSKQPHKALKTNKQPLHKKYGFRSHSHINLFLENLAIFFYTYACYWIVRCMSIIAWIYVIASSHCLILHYYCAVVVICKQVDLSTRFVNSYCSITIARCPVMWMQSDCQTIVCSKALCTQFSEVIVLN